MNPAESALLAKHADVAIVFGIRVEGEGFDLPDLTLPWGQDAVIEAVAAFNLSLQNVHSGDRGQRGLRVPVALDPHPGRPYGRALDGRRPPSIR